MQIGSLNCRRFLVGLLVMIITCTGVQLMSTQTAWTQSEDTLMYEEGPIVRRKLLFRSTRFEAHPHLGVSVNDAFRRNILGGINLNYHLTNNFALGGSFAYGVVHVDTDLASNVTSVVQNGRPALANTLGFSELGWVADFTLQFVPAYGKFSILKKGSLNYDVHLIGGFLLLNESPVAAVPGGQTDAALEGIRPGATVGLGMRVFFGDMVSLNMGLKNLLASRTLVSTGTSSAAFTNTVMATVGVGIFFPGDVKISR